MEGGEEEKDDENLMAVNEAFLSGRFPTIFDAISKRNNAVRVVVVMVVATGGGRGRMPRWGEVGTWTVQECTL